MVWWDRSSKSPSSFFHIYWENVLIYIIMVRLTASFKMSTASFSSSLIVFSWLCLTSVVHKIIRELGIRELSAQLPVSQLVNSLSVWFLIAIPSLLSAFSRCEDPNLESSRTWQLSSSFLRITGQCLGNAVLPLTIPPTKGFQSSVAQPIQLPGLQK